MAKNESKVTGLDGATAMLAELNFLTSANIGADFLADQAREPTWVNIENGTKTKGTPPTHADVLEYLAIGGRSLYPSEEDSKKAGKLIRDRIAKHLKRTGQTVTNKKGVSRVLTKDRQAMAGAASGLKSGAKYLAKKMLERLQKGSTTGGGKAKKVTEDYAQTRIWNYNVDKSVVYIASGQLANAIASGKVKLYLKDANVSNLLKNIE